jgi:hypothetical protein
MPKLTLIRGGKDILAELADRFAGRHGGRESDVQASAAALHGNEKPRIGAFLHIVWDAGRFAAEKEHISVRKGEFGVGHSGFGGKQDQPASFAEPPFLEARKVDVSGEGGHFEIMHSGTPEIAVGEVETGWLDNVDADAETGGHTQNRSGIPGNIGLVERDSDGSSQFYALLICGLTVTVFGRDRVQRLNLSADLWSCEPNAAIEPSLSIRTNGGSHDEYAPLAPSHWP